MREKNKPKINQPPHYAMSSLGKVEKLRELGFKINDLIREYNEIVNTSDREDYVIYPGDYFKLNNATSDYYVVSVTKVKSISF